MRIFISLFLVLLHVSSCVLSYSVIRAHNLDFLHSYLLDSNLLELEVRYRNKRTKGSHSGLLKGPNEVYGSSDGSVPHFQVQVEVGRGHGQQAGHQAGYWWPVQGFWRRKL